MGQDRFASLLVVAAALIVVAPLAALSLTGPLSWVVGLIYIGYDTWLLGHMVRTGRRGPSAPALVLGPLEFLGRLATLIPHPRGATSVDAGRGDQRGKLPGRASGSSRTWVAPPGARRFRR